MLSSNFLRRLPTALAAVFGLLGCIQPVAAQTVEGSAEVSATSVKPSAPEASPKPEQRLFVREYRVTGATKLPRLDVERAVYRYLGPARTIADVEKAREALEKTYHDRGYAAVSVIVPADQPPARVQAGVIELRVLEGTVGQLHVKGAKYSSPKAIAAMVPSLAEGEVPNFNQVKADFTTMTPVSGRSIVPDIRLGRTPGTIDVDLKVEERVPVEASVELNNRYSADTTKLRLNASAGFLNLWQAGHVFNMSYQVAPGRRSDSEVISGYYLLPLGNESGDNLMIQGSHQESDIATLGITPTIGRGNSAGIRYIHTLPLPFVPASPPPQPEGSPAKLGEQNAPERFHHSISAGFDYKQNYQHVTSTVLDPRGGPATTTIRETDTTSYPFMATYSLLWEKGRWRTQLNAGLTFHFRGMGSSLSDLGDSRFAADGAYALFRADLTETVILPADFRAVSIIQGQITDRPLLPSEQIAAGGLGTVRGYLEAETSGDNGAFGSIEIQSLSLIPKSWGELRLHSFCDWGWVGNNDRLSGEKDHRLYSIGGGTRLKLGRYFTGSLDLGLPLVDGPRTRHDDLHLTFRAGIDY